MEATSANRWTWNAVELAEREWRLVDGATDGEHRCSLEMMNNENLGRESLKVLRLRFPCLVLLACIDVSEFLQRRGVESSELCESATLAGL